MSQGGRKRRLGMPERRGGGRRPGREASWSKASTPSSSSTAAGSSPEWPGARCSLPQAHPLQRPPQAPGSRVLSRVGRGSGCWWVRHGGAPRPPPTRCPVLALAGRRPYPACAVARGTDWTVRRPRSPGCRQCSILWATPTWCQALCWPRLLPHPLPTRPSPPWLEGYCKHSASVEGDVPCTRS